MRRNRPKSYMYAQGNGYIVCHWSDHHNIYCCGVEIPYFQARASVGTANCPNPETCTKSTHQHYLDENGNWE